MRIRGWAAVVSAFAFIVAGALSFPAWGETTTVRYGLMVTGIVTLVDGNILTVDGKTFDAKGVPVRFTEGSSPWEKPSLRGKLVQIVIYHGKIDSILVLNPKAQ